MSTLGTLLIPNILILTLMQKSYFKIETVLATWEGRNKGKVLFYYFPCFFFFFFSFYAFQ